MDDTCSASVSSVNYPMASDCSTSSCDYRVHNGVACFPLSLASAAAQNDPTCRGGRLHSRYSGKSHAGDDGAFAAAPSCDAEVLLGAFTPASASWMDRDGTHSVATAHGDRPSTNNTWPDLLLNSTSSRAQSSPNPSMHGSASHSSMHPSISYQGLTEAEVDAALFAAALHLSPPPSPTRTFPKLPSHHDLTSAGASSLPVFRPVGQRGHGQTLALSLISALSGSRDHTYNLLHSLSLDYPSATPLLAQSVADSRDDKARPTKGRPSEGRPQEGNAWDALNLSLLPGRVSSPGTFSSGAASSSCTAAAAAEAARKVQGSCATLVPQPARGILQIAEEAVALKHSVC